MMTVTQLGTHGEDSRHLGVKQTGHAAEHDQARERGESQQGQLVAGCKLLLEEQEHKHSPFL